MRAGKKFIAVGAVALGLLVPTTTVTASAERAAVPLLDRPVQRAEVVVFKGRTTPRATVRLQVRDGRWRSVRLAKASASGSYKIVFPRPAATLRFRAAAAGRVSKVRVVTGAPTAQQPTGGTTTTDTDAAEAARAPRDACGVRPRKADGTYWACTMNDEFTGTSLDTTRWSASSGAATGYCLADHPSTVSVGSGVLRLSARPAAADVSCTDSATGLRAPYMTGQVSTFWKWSQQYGRFEARMKVQRSSTVGLQEAFWLWPDIRTGVDTTTWPLSGEIDIVELYSQYPGLAIPFLHYTANDNGGPVPGLNTAWNCATTRGDWHTYTLNWTADKVEILVDGRTCLVNTAGASSFRKPFIIALSQLMGIGANAPTGATTMPATTEVDYVRVWE